MKKIKETEAKKICETYGYDYAIIIGVRASDGAGGIATYGMDKKLCKHAAYVADDIIAPTIFGPKATAEEEIKRICLEPTPQMRAEGDCFERDCMTCEGKETCFNF